MTFLYRFRDMSNPNFVALVLVLYLSLSLPLLMKWPAPMGDESLFGSTAKTLLDKGHLGTNIVRGLETHVYWQPPAYFLSLVPVIKIGGYSLTTLRSWSVFVAGGVLVVVFILVLQLADALAAKIAILLLACDPKFVNTVMHARMDGLCVLFMLIAVAILAKPLFEDRVSNALAAGTAASLATLTHPLGLVTLMVCFLYMLGQPPVTFREKVKELCFFFLPVVIGAILWGLYILQDPHSFMVQMKFQFARKDRPVLQTLAGVVGQYRMYPLSLLIPCVGVGFMIRRALRNRGRVILVAAFQLAVMIVVVLKYENPYSVHLAPLGSIAGGIFLMELWKSGSKAKRTIAAGFGYMILMNTVIVFGYLNFVYHHRLADETNYEQFGRVVAQHISHEATIIDWGTPSLYWRFNADRPDIDFRDPTFLDSLTANEVIRGVNYIVLSRAFRPVDDMITLQERYVLLSELCTRNGRELKQIAIVGTNARFAYSAQIYEVVAKDAK